MEFIYAHIAKSEYSQMNQDIWVLKATNFKRNGYFIDFGAGDGVELSNTYKLEKDYNWTGIICEPNKKFQENIAKTRSCFVDHRCVYSETGKQLKFLAVTNNPELSSVEEYAFLGDEFAEARKQNESYIVPSVSLNDLLEEYDAPKNIDYISVDTEGSEFDILQSFDFSKYNVKLFTIEHNWMPPRQKIYDLMISNGYKRVHEEYSRWDDWYIKN